MGESSEKLRGLWAVMKGTADKADESAAEAEQPVDAVKKPKDDNADNSAGGGAVGTDKPADEPDPSPTGDAGDSAADGPADGIEPDSESPAPTQPKPKSLWSVMRSSEESPGPPVSSGAGSAPAVDAPETANSEPDRPSSSAEVSAPLKGLWGVMSGSAVGAGLSESRSIETADESGSAEAETPPSTESAVKSEADGFYVGHPMDHEPGSGSANGTAVRESPVSSERLPELPFAAIEESRTLQVERENVQSKLRSPPDRSKKALASCLMGLCALPLSALSLLTQVWLRFPATILGFAALVLGLLAWQEGRGARGRRRSDSGDLAESAGSTRTGRELAGVGMTLGVLAMFLGPVIFARLGQGFRSSSGRERTIANLETIGHGVLEHHREHGRYPPGGIFRIEEDGSQRPMHGWMAALLPYVGQEELHGAIDFEQPYDHPVNLSAMREEVPVFFAAGAERRPVGRLRLAPAHFAGVGGQLNLEGVGLVDVGVFGRGSDVTREDVTDGLSQTFLAGEIGHFFPPWGEPENWRTIGRGLNREANGFGNAEGTGALFLKADGSVRFYSNDTAIDVLQKLSTRNAGDVVPEQYR